MVDITANELDELCDNFENMKFKAESWWPSIEEIQTYIEPNLKVRMPFAIWVTETANEPQTDEEKASKKYLLKLIYDNLNVIDEGEENA